MSFMKDNRKSWNLIWHPSKEANVRFRLRRSLAFYYEVTLLPFFLALVLLYANLVTGRAIPMTQLLPRIYSPGAPFVIFIALFLWVLVPLGFFVNAFIYQVVGRRFLRTFKENYEKTFTALVFGSLPATLLFWLFFIPVVRDLAFIVIPVWEMVVLIISISVQQRITRLQTLGTILTIVLLVMLVFSLASALRVWRYDMMNAYVWMYGMHPELFPTPNGMGTMPYLWR